VRFARMMEPSVSAIAMIHRAVAVRLVRARCVYLHPCPRHSLRGTLSPMKALL